MSDFDALPDIGDVPATPARRPAPAGSPVRSTAPERPSAPPAPERPEGAPPRASRPAPPTGAPQGPPVAPPAGAPKRPPVGPPAGAPVAPPTGAPAIPSPAARPAGAPTGKSVAMPPPTGRPSGKPVDMPAPGGRPVIDEEQDEDATVTGWSRPVSERLAKQAVPLEDVKLEELLLAVIELKGSDLHIAADKTSRIRVSGRLRDLTIAQHKLVLRAQDTERMLLGILSTDQQKRLEEVHELDFAYDVPGVTVGRFRCNFYYSRGALQAAFRLIPYEIKTIDDLNLPETIRDIAFAPRGLVLVCGPTGSGKTTTLAAMINEVNEGRDTHILTIEDPIEFIHPSKMALVTQRELHADTYSFHNALKSALRQDPDIILVGEMRDPETMALAIEAAETGHLVFATVHSQDAAQTVDRIVQTFPEGQQEAIRAQLAMSLQAIIVQQLVPTVNGKGRIAACEIMLGSHAVRNLISTGKNNQLYSTIQSAFNEGMRTMEFSLAEAMAAGKITRQMAEARASKPELLMELIEAAGRQSNLQAALKLQAKRAEEELQKGGGDEERRAAQDRVDRSKQTAGEVGRQGGVGRQAPGWGGKKA